MEIWIENIPRDKYLKLSQDIHRLLLVGDYGEIEVTDITNEKDEYIGCSYEMRKDK